MKTVVVTTINGVDILASPVNVGLVPVRPICEMLGIDSKNQRDKLNANPLYSSVGVLSTSTGADGKTYQMYCLPIKYIYGWLLGINASNVKPEVKDNLIKFQRECCDALEEYFSGKHKKRDTSIERTVLLIREKEQLRNKTDKTAKDFERYIEIEDELKKEQSERAKLTRNSVSEYQTLFSRQEMCGL